MSYKMDADLLRLDKLRERKQALITYMESSIYMEDWHAVSDAANDLREIDLELNLLGKHVDSGYRYSKDELIPDSIKLDRQKAEDMVPKGVGMYARIYESGQEKILKRRRK